MFKLLNILDILLPIDWYFVFVISLVALMKYWWILFIIADDEAAQSSLAIVFLNLHVAAFIAQKNVHWGHLTSVQQFFDFCTTVPYFIKVWHSFSLCYLLSFVWGRILEENDRNRMFLLRHFLRSLCLLMNELCPKTNNRRNVHLEHNVKSL